MSTLKVVSIEDSAVDVVASEENIKDYLLHRDMSLLKFLPAEKPTVFHLALIKTRAFTQYVDLADTAGEKYLRAFQVSCVQIDDLVTPDGDPIPLVKPAGKTQAGSIFGTFVTDEQLDDIPPAYVSEMGKIAYERSRLGKRSGAIFQPLPSSLTGLAQRKAEVVLSQAAESTVTTSSSKSKQEPQEPPTPSNGNKVTDVTAEVETD